MTMRTISPRVPHLDPFPTTTSIVNADWTRRRNLVWVERALGLDPHHPEADASLRIAREQTHSLELTPSAWERYLSFGGVKFFTVLAAIVFWATIVLLILRPRKGIWAALGLFLTASYGF